MSLPLVKWEEIYGLSGQNATQVAFGPFTAGTFTIVMDGKVVYTTVITQETHFHFRVLLQGEAPPTIILNNTTYTNKQALRQTYGVFLLTEMILVVPSTSALAVAVDAAELLYIAAQTKGSVGGDTAIPRRIIIKQMTRTIPLTADVAPTG